tara:strand:- start:34487 stop:35014 length:528 start_codon:yes stop_codon:yes gene_type:complete
MKTFSVKELSRIETEIDEEISFVKGRMRSVRNERLNSANLAESRANKAIKEALSKLESLLSAKFAIRSVKQIFNAEKGINEKTRKIAELTERKALLDSAAGFGDVSARESYGSNKVEYNPGISTDTEDSYRAKSRAVQRQIQRLKDSCQGINNQGTIELDGTVYETLVACGLIDA